MLLQLFKTVLLQSAVGAILILVLLLLKPVTKRIFGSRWQYYIWLCVLVVMVLPPITILAPGKSVVHVPGLPQVQSAKTDEMPGILPDTETKIIENIPFEYRNVEIIQGFQISQHNFLIYIWFAGTAVFFLKNAISYLLFLRTIYKHSKQISCPILENIKTEKGVRSNIRVCVTPCIKAPLISGFFQPTLLLPDAEISDESLRYILLHELTHHKRHDLWYKWFSMIVNAIHWFNPMIYFAVRQINEECEISCDLAVVQDMNTEERKGYMRTILCMMAQNKPLSPVLASAMSGSKEQIKRRFKMISKEKRLNKFMSAVSLLTAVVILSITLFVGSALAATTQDGLEIWTKNEVYFRDGIQFSVNVSGKSVPAWVSEDVAGEDGNINVTVNRVQIRNVKGEVGDYAILELKGAKGTTRLSDIMASRFHKTSYNGSVPRIPELLHEAFTSGYRFCEFNNVGYEGYRNSPVASLVTENSGKRKSVNVDFAFRENESLSTVYVDFLVANEFDNVEYSEEQKYTPIKVNSNSIEFIGNFEKDYVFWARALTTTEYFTFFEKDFVNKKVAGINIAVDSADTQRITLNAAVSHPQVSSYEIYVYNQNERMISSKKDKKIPAGSLALEPTRYRNATTGPYVYKDIPENQFVSGETYRVDVALFDRAHKVIYRQRESVSIP